jgi:hypothetical protein
MRVRRVAAPFVCAVLTTSALASAPPREAPCPAQVAVAPAKSDVGTRHSAQRGLNWLAVAATQWTASHQCFGCHVQAVTLEGLTVGRHNHYDVAPKDVNEMVRAMLMGVTAGGHKTGVAFQGAAWARYDQWVDVKQKEQLLRYARELIGFQEADGSVHDDDLRKPVVAGTMQTTFQAMQTWRQAYARTADDQWLAPMRRAERYLSATSASWTSGSDVYLQDANYALLGLVSAGVGSGEESSVRLQRWVRAKQNKDGGWGLEPSASDAIATGQSLYALKMAGMSDQDPVISRGMSWLVEHQASDGSWHERSAQGGADKGATMWAVLGLVTVDVVSVAVEGITDGQHVAPSMPLKIDARDNQGQGVSNLTVLVDDLPLKTACGAALAYTWDTRTLSQGKHIVQVVATGAKGQKSERSYEVYAGNVFLTQVGTRFDEQKQATEITMREIAPEAGGKVELQVFQVDDSTGEPKAGKQVFATDQKGSPGGMTFAWDGNGSDGKPQQRGRYFAKLVYRDVKGVAVQSEQALFFQDSERVQREKFGEVEGQLALHGGAEQAANAVVDLLDEKGNVVQSTHSTEQGNYRFKNVDQGRYTVRARKEGFKDLSAKVESAPAAAPAKADLVW